jgi:hypothetical protein
MIPYAATTLPAVAPFTFLIRSVAASLRPFLSRTPVIRRIIMKIAILLFATKFTPMVSKRPPTPRPPTIPVVISARKMIRIESSLSANPTITITTPSNLISSI